MTTEPKEVPSEDEKKETRVRVMICSKVNPKTGKVFSPAAQEKAVRANWEKYGNAQVFVFSPEYEELIKKGEFVSCADLLTNYESQKVQTSKIPAY